MRAEGRFSKKIGGRKGRFSKCTKSGTKSGTKSALSRQKHQ